LEFWRGNDMKLQTNASSTNFDEVLSLIIASKQKTYSTALAC
jgi:hypothetical protein